MNKDIMKKIGFEEEVERADEKSCPTCTAIIDVSEFTDQLSIKEYGISGMCQKCQDDFFEETKSFDEYDKFIDWDVINNAD